MKSLVNGFDSVNDSGQRADVMGDPVDGPTRRNGAITAIDQRLSGARAERDGAADRRFLGSALRTVRQADDQMLLHRRCRDLDRDQRAGENLGALPDDPAEDLGGGKAERRPARRC
jgi:hypothetical protein